MLLLVFCSRPGLGVAGIIHPQFAAYPVTHFSEEQLRTLIADRHISLAIGAPLHAEGVSEFIEKFNPGGATVLPEAPASTAPAPAGTEVNAPLAAKGGKSK